MVASSHSLEELGVTHPASASGDRGAPETNRTAQTALDKRSRLSNVINNLRKKVPEVQPHQQQQKNDNDGRNSVERNLENLEKYVMTVLNGVIKDEAEKVDENNLEDGSVEARKNRSLSSATNEIEALTPTNIKASYPGNEASKIEGEEWRSVVGVVSGGEGAKGADKNADEALEGAKNVVEDVSSRVSEILPAVNVVSCKPGREERPPLDPGKTNLDDDSADGITSGDQAQDTIVQKSPFHDSQITEDSVSSTNPPNNLMDVCRELMSDLLNDINNLIEERSRDPEVQDSRFSGSSPTSLHCSLPLEKVAPILRSCHENQTSSASSSSPQRSPSRPSPPIIRHLCLYCDRKFLSISLRQRHAERVHQVGGGSRRSERNSRRTVQNCQYCSEKVNSEVSEGSSDSEATSEALDSLDSLFRHMAKSHPDRYYACVQCSTRYATRETLTNHAIDVHGSAGQDNAGRESPKDRSSPSVIREQPEVKTEEETVKKDAFQNNPASPEFDSSFYSSVSCNIRENLLHHLDGKLQTNTPLPVIPAVETKPQQQNFYESHNATQIQFPIDISLTAATPVYTSSKEYSNDGNENSSEYAQKPGKTRIHPRRVSFEKYNFPRKYDGKEPWSCSIKDLSKFDISTQLTLRKKQQLTKALMNGTLNRLCQSTSNEQINPGSTIRQSGLTEIPVGTTTGEENGVGDVHDALGNASVPSEDSSPNSPRCSDLNMSESTSKTTLFTTEFASFMRLQRWNEVVNDGTDHREIVYAELSGEWSRPRIYVCGACADRHVTLKEMEEHKACAHPNVWCSHFEFAGDQRELYKHLFVPGQSLPTAKARAAISPDKICTKCSRNCNTLAELHRHMLECGGDQTWLLGLFGNGKKKCKWRPFGSRSRRRRQRGMKRNIQNSQTPRANTPKERPTNGPRVRPSDRESIQKMLANLPPKRASRKVLREENLARSREAAQTVQTRSRPLMSAEVSSSAVQSRNKTVLKNKLLKNAKSFQRNRSRIDNITAVIESVVSCRIEHSTNEAKIEAKRNDEPDTRMTKITTKNFLSVLSKKKNVKTKDSTIANIEHPRTRGRPSGGIRVSNRSKVNATSLTGRNLSAKVSTKGGSGKQTNSVNSKNQSHNHHQREQQSGEKNSKDSAEPEESEETAPTCTTMRTRKRKLVDPIASLNASIKAKQQLRTNDGKFARNPNKKDIQPFKILRDRYPRRHANPAEFVPKSRIKATKEFSKNQITTKSVKRGGRASSDSDKMPTLEPAVPIKNSESGAEGDADKPGRGNELPVLSLAAIGAERRASRNVAVNSKEVDKDGSKKNIASDHLDLDDVLEKSVIDVAELKNRFNRENALQRKNESDQTRTRRTRGKRINLNIAPPTPVTSSASSSFSSSSSSSCSSSSTSSISSPLTGVKERSRNQRNSSRRRNNVDEHQEDRRSKVIEKLVDKEDLMTRLGLKVCGQKPRRSARTSLSKERGDETYTSQDDISNSRRKREKVLGAELPEEPGINKVGRTRKSPRNLAARNLPKAVALVAKTKDSTTNYHDDERISEKLGGDDEEDANDPKNPHLQVNLDRENDLEDDLEEDPEDPAEETNSGLPKRGRGLGKRRGRIKAVEVKDDDLETPKTEDEETSESMANLSLEHLQHESNNSNVDSGKENSSETPITLPKPRTVRPRKTKSGRPGRERTAKRISSVIGILTEGVNIPVEIQQSVVLTVQTSSVNSEPANSESEVRPRDENQSDQVVEDKSISEKVNEDSDDTDDKVKKLDQTRCSHSPNDTNESGSDKDKPEVCDIVVHDDDSSGKSQVVEDAVPLKTLADHETPVSQENLCFDPIPAPGNSTSTEKPASVEPETVVEPPTDIIMDLSRRKPNGKGSFLEKIVSKIAKQKDALLVEGDVGSLLDNAAEELTNILDEVAPNLTGSTENLMINPNEARTEKVAEIKVDAEDELEICPKVETTVSPVHSEPVEEASSLEPVAEVGPPLDENRLMIISASESSVLSNLRESRAELNVDIKVNEDFTTSKKRAFETNTPKKNKRKTVDSEAISESEDLMAEELCLADIMKLIQNSKTNEDKDNNETARPGKRKPATENDQETLREELENDESDLQNTVKSLRPEDGDSKRPRRRSVKKKSLVEEHLPLLDVEQSSSLPDEKGNDSLDAEVCKNLKASSKKMNKRKTLPDEDPEIPAIDTDESPNSVGNRSAKRRSLLNDQKSIEEVSASSSLCSKSVSRGCTSKGLIQENETQRKSSKRKSSFDSENEDKCVDNNSVNLESERCKEDSISKAKNVKRLTDDYTSLEETSEISNTDNPVEILEKKSLTKKRKSVTEGTMPEEECSREDESKNEEIIDESKKFKTSIVTAEDSCTTMKRRTSKRTTSHVDQHLDLDSDDSVNSSRTEGSIYAGAETKIESSEVVERLRTLRRRNSKRKSLAEDHLELFGAEEEEEAPLEKFKIPEISELHYSRSRRSSKRSLTLGETDILQSSKDQMDAAEETETSRKRSGVKKPSIEPLSDESSSDTKIQIAENLSKTSIMLPLEISLSEKVENLGKSLINEHLNLSDEDGEDLVTRDIEDRNEELNESIISTAETDETPEISTEDDQQQQIPKKRGSGNFAVGHTKTGEILIVEKKKKLTKEAARFFCEVCATSFTRKSSLKKHNSSQSHLVQVAKLEKAPETEASPPGEEDDEKEAEKDGRNQDYWGSEESLQEAIGESIENILQTDNFNLKPELNRVLKNPMTPQISEEEALEEELLDEEICKITENMTHDDFVLTDHISPELPLVNTTGKNKNCKKPSQAIKSSKKTDTSKIKKRNLAEEHLDLDSPSPQLSQNTDENLTSDFKNCSTPLYTDSSRLRILKSEKSSASELASQDAETLKRNSDPEEFSINKTNVNLPEETLETSSRSSIEAFYQESLEKVEDIPLEKLSNVSPRVVSIPVTIQRDVLIPSDESSSDRPLAEVLMKSTLSRSRNSRRCVTPEEKPNTEKQDSMETLTTFINITEKLNSQNDSSDRLNGAKIELNTVEFESDDNSMDTRISVDIRKLLDDPEMSGDDCSKQCVERKRETNELSIDEGSNNDFGAKEGRGKHARDKAARENESDKFSGKKHTRKSRSVKLKRKQKIAERHVAGSDSSEDDNSDVDTTSESRNKNKIVKSVFGRVFGGEKVEKVEKIQDKVKEVLEDWNSRSEDDSRGRNTPLSSPAMSSSTGSKRNSRSKKRRNRSKTKIRDDEERPLVMVTESRSRRSKKRAEERISKAFEDEFISVHKENSCFIDENDRVYDFPDVSTGSRASTKIYDIDENDDDKWAIFSGETVKRDKTNLKISSVVTDNENVIPETEDPFIRVPLPPWPSMLPSSPSPSSPGQSSVARSSVRNRSPTPDRNSQSSAASDFEDDCPRGRLSPPFVRNTPDTSMDSVNSNNEALHVFPVDNRILPLVVSSEILKRQMVDQSEVVTIAPTDAVEDNALDVPRPTIPQSVNMPQKPRQAKVLNFDEELFVECCSRLKATTENELRGAKKIEIDHSDGYHKKDGGDGVGFRSIRDRWRDVESQNSLGSLLESVNQLLGEERYANNDKEYSKHATRDPRSENSSRSGSPDLEISRPPDNLGYEDSLDVAFEHNNKLRDKIQQRMRASENLIASSFACETPAPVRHSYGDQNLQRVHAIPSIPTDESRNTPIAKSAMHFDEKLATGKNTAALDSAGFKHKMTSTLGGLLDKLALSNLLHSTAKHDHNGSTPMKVLAELACARAPTTTPSDLTPEIISTMHDKQKDLPARKIRNPIKELFERKKELNDRNQTEKTRAVVVAVAALKELNVQRQRKTTKKSRKRVQEFPLVRKSPYGGMAERKKRKDISLETKDEAAIHNDKVKDVYDFDDEESQAEVPMPSVVSFRSKTLSGEPDLVSLASKTIVETLENGKEADILGRRLESMIDRKFKEVEKSAPKTKGALKAFQNDRGNQKEHSDAESGLDRAKDSNDADQETTLGPMDDFVQRKQHQCNKRNSDTGCRSKSKKRGKASKKKPRAAAWYENDSSDEFKTAAKTEDIGVGISKSQRTCSKGKQNLFAELSSTSSDSEIENEVHLDYIAKRGAVKRDTARTVTDELPDDDIFEQHNDVDVEPEDQQKTRNHSETKKSESEMSDHPLIIDERRESDEDSSARNNYEPSFEMDDLYREDSSDEADTECPVDDGRDKNTEESIEGLLPKTKFLKDDELIPLEEALDLLDQHETLQEANENEKEFLTDQETKEEARNLRNEEFQDYTESPVEKIHEEEELAELPEKLSSNEKPDKASDNLPLHVFLSRKVQESKKRKQQHLKKLQEEQERILLELQPTRRQRKCAIGKQGLLAEISSSDEELYDGGSSRKFHDKERSNSPDKPRRQKRESREKRKERYIEKKHEQIIAKEQKAIQEEILRELGKTAPPEILDKSFETSFDEGENKINDKTSPKKQKKQKPKKATDVEADTSSKAVGSESENNGEMTFKNCESPSKQKKQSKTDQKSQKKSSGRTKKHSECNGKETKDGKDRKSSGMKRDSTDEELRTTKSWNKVEEGVGVAIGRRKRAAANQLYYWSSSSDEEEEIIEEPLANVEEEDDRQEQHGWIVGDSHKRMITMLAMEKQLKEKRRRSEDEFEPNKSKNKKHRNSTS